MKNFSTNLEKYAELSIRTGVNIQEDQTLIILANIETAAFVRAAAIQAYEAGAKHVHVEWVDEALSLLKMKHAPMEVLESYPDWKKQAYTEWVEDGAAFLSISASNPDLMKDVDADRIGNARKASATALNTFRTATQANQVSWTVIAVPTKAWAAKVFPDLSEKESTMKLWEYIFKATRADVEDPVQAWKEHTDLLKQKVNDLNKQKFKKLIYQASGTDLTIELPKTHVWVGGGVVNQQDVYNIHNIPTEEVFTLPLKTGVNGIVSSTKPLNYGGSLIENFSLTFKDGKIVDFTAETGYEALQKLIETDEGSHYLGEVSLVPHRSPISDMDVIFYNTLFDENASCHLAIGSAYPNCVENGEKLSREELDRLGVNNSLTHVDFMMGSAEMNIDGETQDGTRVPLFRNGNWA